MRGNIPFLKNNKLFLSANSGVDSILAQIIFEPRLIKLAIEYLFFTFNRGEQITLYLFEKYKP